MHRSCASGLLFAVVSAGMWTAAVPARAGGKVKAHVECMSGLPLKSGKAAKLTAELSCTIRVDSLGSYKAADLKGTMTVLPSPKSTLKMMPEGQSGALADTQDGVEFRLENPYTADKDYKVCEPFTIAATVRDENLSADHMDQWSTTFKVAASCPVPKKVAASLRCHYMAQDGTLIKWPGNGVKLKPRMEGTLFCSVVASKTEKDLVYAVTLSVAKKGTPKQGGFEHDEAGGAFFDAQFEPEVYESCSSFTVAGEVKASGGTLWSGKLAIKQDCPD